LLGEDEPVSWGKESTDVGTWFQISGSLDENSVATSNDSQEREAKGAGLFSE
jgi:hypothetical protein